MRGNYGKVATATLSVNGKGGDGAMCANISARAVRRIELSLCAPIDRGARDYSAHQIAGGVTFAMRGAGGQAGGRTIIR